MTCVQPVNGMVIGLTAEYRRRTVADLFPAITNCVPLAKWLDLKADSTHIKSNSNADCQSTSDIVSYVRSGRCPCDEVGFVDGSTGRRCEASPWTRRRDSFMKIERS